MERYREAAYTSSDRVLASFDNGALLIPLDSYERFRADTHAHRYRFGHAE
jgi:hypothetical protein